MFLAITHTNKKRLFLFIISSLWIGIGLHAQTDSIATVTDSVKPNKISRWDSLFDWNFLAVPTIAYQPETNWSFGLAGAYYFKLNDEKTSDIGFDMAYTLNKQWNVNVLSTMYFGGNKRWFMYTNVGFKRYPDLFYGIGNRTNQLLAAPIHYSSDNVYLTAQPQYYITEHWIVGANVTLRWEQASTTANLDSIGTFCSTSGLEKPYFMVGLGGIISYDSRDQQFYPSRGIFFKTVASYYEPYLGSTYRMGKISADFRHFVPIYKELVFAWQAYTEWALGNEKPFQLLPTLGGMDVVRGIRRGTWSDDVMMAVQTELRIPIWRFLKGSIFSSIGDVYNLDDWQWSIPKIGYGAGLRVALNKAKVNVRFDVARQNYDNNWSFYLTIKEAF